MSIIPYITCGYPNLQASYDALEIFCDNGIEVCEIGIPFGDPVSDGKTIQEAHRIALLNGTSIDDVLKLVQHFSSRIKIVLMTYINPVISYPDFIDKAYECGAWALLPVDLPLQHIPPYFDMCKDKLKVVNIVCTSTPIERVQEIVKYTTGFLYVASTINITGTDVSNFDKVGEFAQSINVPNGLPKFVGFGIKTRADVQKVLEYADGAIVGSEIVKNMSSKEQLSTFIKTLI